MMRRYDNPPLKGVYYPPRPGAYGIFWRGEKILLTCNIGGDHPDWQLPGGGIERGEHALPALVREAYEETGWRVNVTRRLSTHRRFVYMPDYGQYAEKICNIYYGRVIARLSEPIEKDHISILVDPIEALQQLTQRAERDALAAYLRSSSFIKVRAQL